MGVGLQLDKRGVVEDILSKKKSRRDGKRNVILGLTTPQCKTITKLQNVTKQLQDMRSKRHVWCMGARAYIILAEISVGKRTLQRNEKITL